VAAPSSATGLALSSKRSGGVEAFYFTLGGPYHEATIIGTPSDVTGWAGYLIAQPAGILTTDVTELIDCSRVDEAAKQARTIEARMN
jgi:hypothetical protein